MEQDKDRPEGNPMKKPQRTEHSGETEDETGKKFIARAETRIYASPRKVWDALVNPAIIRRYMFGTTVVSDWKEGSPVTWRGEWEGKGV